MATKVLVVDDEPDVERMILAKFRRRINSKELEFYFAANGAEALTVLEKEPSIGIILTDINMPVMDGLALLGNLLNLGRVYKAVVVSAYEDMTNIRTAMNRGASDFITKPIDFVDFEKTLEKTIEEYKNLFYYKDMQKELDIAKKMQQDMLPREYTPFPHHPIDIAGKMIAAKEVGGDFFDFFPLDDHRLAVFIADVSGKSISACLYMAITKVLFRMLAKKDLPCSEIMSKLNALLADHSPCMFVTAFYGIIDLKGGTFTYSNAGHNFPHIIHADGNVSAIRVTNGVALGIGDPDTIFANYTQEVINLQEGDCLYLYTDGVTEAMNVQHEMFGENRLCETLKEFSKASTAEIVQGVIDKVKDFVKEAPQSDDITMLAVRYVPFKG